MCPRQAAEILVLKPYLIAADVVLLLHVAFVIFVVAGGLLVLREKRWMWLHLPAAIWGALVEFFNLRCPLTPLEFQLLARAGSEPEKAGVIGRFVIPIVYPDGNLRNIQIVLGTLVVLVNVCIYGWLLHRWRVDPHKRTAED